MSLVCCLNLLPPRDTHYDGILKLKNYTIHLRLSINEESSSARKLQPQMKIIGFDYCKQQPQVKCACLLSEALASPETRHNWILIMLRQELFTSRCSIMGLKQLNFFLFSISPGHSVTTITQDRWYDCNYRQLTQLMRQTIKTNKQMHMSSSHLMTNQSIPMSLYFL